MPINKEFKTAHEWLVYAVQNDEVNESELMNIIQDCVDEDYLTDRFQGDLELVHFFDTKVVVTWQCHAEDHFYNKSDAQGRFFSTTEWRNDIEGTGYTDGFPEVRCPHCDYEMDDSNIISIKEIK